MSNTNELSFEQAYEALQHVLEKLESGDLSLNESVTLYEQGRLFALRCQTLLDNAELRIRKLNEDGTIENH
jgi:exodeoxyribonuclease VII small subunit